MNMRLLFTFLLGSVLLVGCGRTENKPVSYHPENTGINVRDRNRSTYTPLDQSENKADLALTQHIRQKIIGDNELSLNGKNVKIITVEEGVVFLRGPVDSQAEKDKIESIVTKTEGVKRVNNQLEVVSDTKGE